MANVHKTPKRMKIEFIKDHSFFNAKVGDVRNDISQAAMLVGAGYAKLVEAEEAEAAPAEPAAQQAKTPKNKPATKPAEEKKAEEADAKDEAQS